MARTDLLYDVKAGDISLTPSIPDGVQVYNLTITNGSISGLPYDILEASSDNVIYAMFSNITGSENALLEDSTHCFSFSEWLDKNDSDIPVSALHFISFDVFKIRYDSDNERFYIGDGKYYDIPIGEAKEQNSFLLSLCDKGNNYRFPNSGVGIRRFVNSHLSSSVLANEIIKQFKNDSVSVINADFDKDTGQLKLETKEM